jgi:signal transduction histidine kinase
VSSTPDPSASHQSESAATALSAWIARCKRPALLGFALLIVVLAGALLLLAPLPSSWRFGLLLGTLLLAIAAAFAAVLVLRSWRELNAAQQLLELATGNLGQAYTSLVDANQSLRETAEARDDALHRLRTAIRERDAFLAAISHDLKTPLTVIKGNAELLSSQLKDGGTPDRARVARGLEKITANTGRLTSLVDQLLWLAQLEMDQPVDLNRSCVDLVALAERVLQEYKATTSLHHLILTAHVTTVEGWWDEGRIESAVGNLISNAIKYSPDGGAIEVVIDADDDRQMAMLTVRDGGLGIPTLDLPHVFDRFYRAENVGELIVGTGMGLAGVRYAVEAHGGLVSVESAEGVGSAFILELPLFCPVSAQAELLR